MTDLHTIVRTYFGSNGDATKALYAELEMLGAPGIVAINLFRACKNSARAKVYRGRSYRDAAYDRKQWSMDNLCRILVAEADKLGIAWGWGYDAKATGFEHVLYVEIPTGQMSFHTERRGDGPDYAGKWDGVRQASPDRICRWVYRLLNQEAAERAA